MACVLLWWCSGVKAGGCRHWALGVSTSVPGLPRSAEVAFLQLKPFCIPLMAHHRAVHSGVCGAYLALRALVVAGRFRCAGRYITDNTLIVM